MAVVPCGIKHLLQMQGYSYPSPVLAVWPPLPTPTCTGCLLQSVVLSLWKFLPPPPNSVTPCSELFASYCPKPLLYHPSTFCSQLGLNHYIVCQGTLGLPSCPSLEYDQCLVNVYQSTRHQARTFLKQPRIQVWNFVCKKWEGQVFDSHLPMLLTLAVNCSFLSHPCIIFQVYFCTFYFRC